MGIEERFMAIGREITEIRTAMCDAYNATYRQHRMRYEDTNPSRDYWVLKSELENQKPPRPVTPPKIKDVALEQEVAVARWQKNYEKPEPTVIHAWDAAPTLGELLVPPDLKDEEDARRLQKMHRLNKRKSQSPARKSTVPLVVSPELQRRAAAERRTAADSDAAGRFAGSSGGARA